MRKNYARKDETRGTTGAFLRIGSDLKERIRACGAIGEDTARAMIKHADNQATARSFLGRQHARWPVEPGHPLPLVLTRTAVAAAPTPVLQRSPRGPRRLAGISSARR